MASVGAGFYMWLKTVFLWADKPTPTLWMLVLARPRPFASMITTAINVMDDFCGCWLFKIHILQNFQK
jgi:hypothetical protein